MSRDLTDLVALLKPVAGYLLILQIWLQLRCCKSHPTVENAFQRKNFRNLKVEHNIMRK
jgi:hypothetical protein